jgi:ElaB/YqjD/DUF883 family membrane-anchored ribosome-binding protein
MDTTTNEIEDHIEHTREHLSANIQELENKVRSVTDWRRMFQQKPLTLVGAAFGGGVLLGTLTSGGKHHKSR